MWSITDTYNLSKFLIRFTGGLLILICAISSPFIFIAAYEIYHIDVSNTEKLVLVVSYLLDTITPSMNTYFYYILPFISVCFIMNTILNKGSIEDAAKDEESTTNINQ